MQTTVAPAESSTADSVDVAIESVMNSIFRDVPQDLSDFHKEDEEYLPDRTDLMEEDIRAGNVFRRTRPRRASRRLIRRGRA